MATDFEGALAGEHGEDAQRAAEEAVRGAVDALAGMLKPTMDAALAACVATGGFATGGVFNARAATLHFDGGEAILPIGNVLRERALAQGYTDLRFNSETMSWAYHKPDQAVGEDGRTYVKARDV